MNRKKLVLIGNGMAGARTLQEILRLDPEKYRICVFGAEPWGNYNRILLSPVLAGEKTIDEIMINPESWYRERGIELLSGRTVTGMDRNRRCVIADDGTEREYDRLILTTGSSPVVIPVPGADLENVMTFRDIHDVHGMLECSGKFTTAVVIGGGLLGLEAASGLMARGMQVTVVHLPDALMERQLDKTAAGLLQHTLQQRGMKFLLQKQTECIIGEHRVTGVRFSDGNEIPADLVVMATGIRPNIELARRSGLVCERGVLVNDTLRTSDPDIHAVGECVQHRNITYGLVAPLFEQAHVCANHLAGPGDAIYPGSTTATRLKVTGIDLCSAGCINAAADDEIITYTDPYAGIYKKLVIRNARVVGCILYGNADDAGWYLQLMDERTEITPFRDRVIFGRAFTENTIDKQAA